MADPLTIARALHPDLHWMHVFGDSLYGTTRGREPGSLRGLMLICATDSQRVSIAINGDVTHEEDHPGATLEALAAEAVDLRRAIGWPVGVANG